MEREGQNDYILICHGLVNQYLVDIHAKIETKMLNFIINNHSKFPTENYMHLQDAMCKNGGLNSDLCKMVLVPHVLLAESITCMRGLKNVMMI